ncbi:hypothetical protein RchiOBHm_Chr5g0039791 [Rosa chinensis]|uniref:Uncharacterized protein n=1 Tax=Rosa chinensis TaxID=74649 RepID=A0A2P6QCD2_ROSCH|nr:hypothetical protein RchiOBHm_Chr5g0039791 [Rosa chinensis]
MVQIAFTRGGSSRAQLEGGFQCPFCFRRPVTELLRRLLCCSWQTKASLNILKFI